MGKGRSCCLDLTPNSRNKITRKCVATGDENEESDLGSIRLIVVNSVWGAK